MALTQLFYVRCCNLTHRFVQIIKQRRKYLGINVVTVKIITLISLVSFCMS